MATTTKAKTEAAKKTAVKASAKATANAAPKKTAAAKKEAAPKKAAPKKAQPKSSAEGGVSIERRISADKRKHYIEVAAYYIAERRGFAGGNAADDWKAAEEEIDRLLAEGRLNGS